MKTTKQAPTPWWSGPVGALLLCSALLMCAVVTIFVLLIDRQRDIRDSIREDSLWAAYQLDREAGRLRLLLTDVGPVPTAEQVDMLRLRGDILLSRMDYISTGEFPDTFQSCDQCPALLAAVTSEIPHVEQAFADLHQASEDDLAALNTLLAGINRSTAELVVLANAVRTELLVQDRAEIASLRTTLAAAVMALAAAMAGIIAMLVRQLAANARARAGLSALSEDLRTAARKAEAANEAKSRFLAVVSHELRTPLTAILGMADLLGQASLHAPHDRHLSILSHSGRRLLALVNDILDYSRLQAPDPRLMHTPFEPRRLVASALEEARAGQTSDSARLLLEVSPDVPMALMGDPDRLRQVLLNLVANALKFAADGTTIVRMSWRGSNLTVRVEDDGCGISPQEAERLFEPFSQGDNSATRQFGGTGLGLSISRRLVVLMGGTLDIDLDRDNGACFWFTVPLKIAASTGASALPEPLGHPLPGPARQPLRILLAEDNDSTRLLVTTVLRQWGHDVTEATNGAEALDLAQKQTFHVILMDLQMPVMDGSEAIRRIQALDGAAARTPVILLTADLLSPEGLAAGHGVTVQATVSKPVDWNLLRETISAAAGTAPLPHGTMPAASPQAGPCEVAPILDQAALRKLIGAFGDDVTHRLLTSVIDRLATVSASVTAAAADGDQEALSRAAHSLKGMCLQFGLPRLADMARQVQEAAADGDPIPVPIDTLASEAVQGGKALADFLDHMTAVPAAQTAG